MLKQKPRIGFELDLMATNVHWHQSQLKQEERQTVFGFKVLQLINLV
jgi:hypothetical protein